MSLLERFDVGDQIPELYYTYYGRIAWRFESLQSCTDYLRRGFKSGLSVGNPDGGFHCVIHVIKGAFFSGENLISILKEIDYLLHLLESYNNVVVRNYLLNFRETVSTLIDKGSATSIEAKASFFYNGNDLGESAALVQQAIRAYWLGYTERCNHFIEKGLNMIGQSGQHNSYQMKFYYGKETDVTLETMKNAMIPHHLVSSFTSPH